MESQSVRYDLVAEPQEVKILYPQDFFTLLFL